MYLKIFAKCDTLRGSDESERPFLTYIQKTFTLTYTTLRYTHVWSLVRCIELYRGIIIGRNAHSTVEYLNASAH